MSRRPDFFDQWYAEMGRSASRDQIVRRALGLPPDMEASGLLPWAGVAEVAAALNLARRGLELFDSSRRVCAIATALG